MPSLSDIKHLIIDMDGVLYRGDQPMPRLCEFFAFLRERELKRQEQILATELAPLLPSNGFGPGRRLEPAPELCEAPAPR